MSTRKLETRISELEQALSQFSRELQLALQYVQPDAAGSLTKSRVVLEQLVLAMYSLEMGREPRKPLLGEMLADNQFTRRIERRILSRMHAIRDMGNLGPHGEAVEPTDAARALDDLCEVLDWYLRRYGRKPDAEAVIGSAAGEATTSRQLPASRVSRDVRSIGRAAAIALVAAACLVGIVVVFSNTHDSDSLAERADPVDASGASPSAPSDLPPDDHSSATATIVSSPATPPRANEPAIPQEDAFVNREPLVLGASGSLPSILRTRANYQRHPDGGIVFSDRTLVLTRAGTYLTKDFTFEVLLEMRAGDKIAFIGFGEGEPGVAYDEPGNAVNLRFHSPDNSGEILLAHNGNNTQLLGPINYPGTHRVQIVKEGNAVTFTVDVNNDGPTDDDLTATITDITVYAPFLNSRNTYLFFGGSGRFLEVLIES
jgi:hypothetical protein